MGRCSNQYATTLIRIKKGMSFPDKNWLGYPKGWEDLGEIEKEYKKRDNGYQIESHTYCKTPTHIGKENLHLFKFCPRCMIKLES